MRAKLVEDFKYLKPKTEEEVMKGKEELLKGSLYKFVMKEQVLDALKKEITECQTKTTYFKIKYRAKTNAHIINSGVIVQLGWLVRYVDNDFEADPFFNYNFAKSLMPLLKKIIKKYNIK